jgi:hypothetical protein
MTLKTSARRNGVATLNRVPAPDVLMACQGRLLADSVNNYRLLAGIGYQLLARAPKLSGIMADGHFPRKQNPLAALKRADFLPTEVPTR